MPIHTERLNDEEIKVITKSPQGTYEYIFEKYAWSWILREKYIDGEEAKVDDDTNISNTVRQAVKDEARDENKGILDNLDMVTSQPHMLKMKHEDTFAKLGEDLMREIYDNEMIERLSEKSLYDTLEECFFCQEEKYCRDVNATSGDYYCCTDCEEKNPEEIRIDQEEIVIQ